MSKVINAHDLGVAGGYIIEQVLNERIAELEAENKKLQELIRDYYIYQFYDDCFVCRYYNECQDKKDELPFCIAPTYLSERTHELGIKI